MTDERSRYGTYMGIGGYPVRKLVSTSVAEKEEPVEVILGGRGVGAEASVLGFGEGVGGEGLD